MLETNTGHSYAPDYKHWFSLGTAVRLKKKKSVATRDKVD